MSSDALLASRALALALVTGLAGVAAWFAPLVVPDRFSEFSNLISLAGVLLVLTAASAGEARLSVRHTP
jgi:hypothetical protein